MVNVLECLEHTASKLPDKIAFADENAVITYAQLLKRAKEIGTAIANIVKGQRGPVAVMTTDSIDDIAIFMGILYAGCYYVPISASLPQQYRDVRIKTLSPLFLISDSPPQEPANETILTRLRAGQTDNDPAYAMFTSGSTGIPKISLMSHRALITQSNTFKQTFGLSEKSVFGNQASLDFDVSTKTIYSALLAGATAHLIPKKLFVNPLDLIDFLDTRCINTLIWSTSAMRLLASYGALDEKIPLHLELVMFSGETMSIKVLNYWRTHIPNAKYVNLYGPTEITFNCTYFVVNRPFEDAEPLPIGIPFANMDVFLLEGDSAPQAGEEGEICVRGAGVGLGYKGDMERTSERFTTNPLNPSYFERIYRTGDRGRYNDRGELIFLGRQDFQIKYMGYRIELQEIERAVDSLPFLDFGCCVFTKDAKKIILFYQAKEACDKEIAITLRKMLPEYMQPRKMVHMLQLPVNKNGKIDRENLRRMVEEV